MLESVGFNFRKSRESKNLFNVKKIREGTIKTLPAKCL